LLIKFSGARWKIVLMIHSLVTFRSPAGLVILGQQHPGE